jgi:hypothetical protein
MCKNWLGKISQMQIFSRPKLLLFEKIGGKLPELSSNPGAHSQDLAPLHI